MPQAPAAPTGPPRGPQRRRRRAPPGGRPPSLSPGLAWTYALDGAAHAGDETTVVVARAGEDGYLFAGGSPDDLAEETLWNRTWTGSQTLELNPAGEEAPRLFDWPLADGDTWTTPEGTVTACVEHPRSSHEATRRPRSVGATRWAPPDRSTATRPHSTSSSRW
jgi:hypothetical protein